MNNFKTILSKSEAGYNLISLFGFFGANGINTLKNQLHSLNIRFKENDFKYSNFNFMFNEKLRVDLTHQQIKDGEESYKQIFENLPEVHSILNYDFTSEIQKTISSDSFLEDWNSLTNTEKNDLLFIDKSVYLMLREKLETKDFNFILEDLYKEQQELTVLLPEIIQQWILSHSKVTCFNLRKTAQGGEYEDFFNEPSTKNADNNSSESKQLLALQYLSKRNSLDWFNNINYFMFSSNYYHIKYTYDYFYELEEKFIGYDKTKENILSNAPEFVKNWCGLVEAGSLFQKGLDSITFNDIKEQSKGTYYESFFENPLTQKYSKEQGFRRADFMFFILKDKLIEKQNTHKNKII